MGLYKLIDHVARDTVKIASESPYHLLQAGMLDRVFVMMNLRSAAPQFGMLRYDKVQLHPCGLCLA